MATWQNPVKRLPSYSKLTVNDIIEYVSANTNALKISPQETRKIIFDVIDDALRIVCATKQKIIIKVNKYW
jgi:hypothetical protein